jgi:uncharacterized protein (DUF58 family)
MPLTPRTKRFIQRRLLLLFWAAVLALGVTLGLVALLSQEVRFSRSIPNSATPEQKK